ncbi:MAG: benzil reductase ((S)-benzoin forming) [Spirosomataceae bacterium]|jgi:benzil reductase ((S)-benzoin forming)
MKYFIITGASKGIGAGIAKELLKQGNTVIGISRSKNPELTNLIQHSVDLANTETLETTFSEILQTIDLGKATGIFLINNAGLLAPMKPIQKASGSEIAKHINVNVIAPMILSSVFIRELAELNIRKRILNISSGAGKNPYFGWSAYCTSKAGIDMFSRTVSVEQQETKNPVEVISFAPGVVDTEMQSEIRATDEEDFINLPRFKEMHEAGVLQDSDTVGKFIADYLQSDRFEDGGVVDIRDFDE